MKRKNPVARNCRRFNKAAVMTDRKKAGRRGYRKHKGCASEENNSFSVE